MRTEPQWVAELADDVRSESFRIRNNERRTRNIVNSNASQGTLYIRHGGKTTWILVLITHLAADGGCRLRAHEEYRDLCTNPPYKVLENMITQCSSRRNT